MTRLLQSSHSLSEPSVYGFQVPRIGTPRDEAWPTKGAKFSALAELSGVVHDPWQRHIGDVALEYDPQTGRWRRDTVGLVVGRQNGKTTVLEDRVLASLYLFDEERLVLHTAQDRTAPFELFKSLRDRITTTWALRRKLHPKKGIVETNGKEEILLKDGSRYKILAPRPGAFRGWSADLLIYDEAREQKSWELDVAASPTLSARPNSQKWIVSNAGTSESVVLNTLIDRGRSAVANPGSDPKLAYFEWSSDPALPIDDETAWAQSNPSYGYRILRDTIEAELSAARLDPEALNGFITERLCRQVAAMTARAIPFDQWMRCVDHDQEPIGDGLPRPTLGIDIDGDRTAAAIVVAVRRGDRIVVDMVSEFTSEGAIDLAAVIQEALYWMNRYRITEFAYDPMTCATVAQSLEAQGKSGNPIRSADRLQASGNLFDAVLTGTLAHPDHESLNVQVEAAVRKSAGDGLWYISRSSSPIAIPGVVALAAAINLQYRPTPKLDIR